MGRLISEFSQGHIEKITYQDHQIKFYTDGKLMWIKEFNQAGLLSKIVGPDEVHGVRLNYLPDGSLSMQSIH